jgi:hypothetical protein
MAGLHILQSPDFPIPWSCGDRVVGNIAVRICDSIGIGRALVRPHRGLAGEGHGAAPRRIESGMTMSGRSIAVLGIVFLALGGPVEAQAPVPADREAWGNEQVKPSDRTPPATRQSPPRPPRDGPPARAEDEFDPPAAPGCQFRENKLDLLV